MDTTDERVRSGPQSKIPPILFWLVVAAIVLRIVTASLDRGKKDEGSGLVRWQPHEKAAAAARSEGKPVLYDFTAAWCPPCHRLDTEGWGDSRVASLVNDSYLPARIVDRAREEGKNSASIDELPRRYWSPLFRRSSWRIPTAGRSPGRRATAERKRSSVSSRSPEEP
jgi:thiol-disulfide isomerase/thioredoxin